MTKVYATSGASVELNRRQQINVLKYLLKACISQELKDVKHSPSFIHLEKYPFTDFAAKVWFRTFPWTKDDGNSFWNGIEDLIQLLNTYNTTAAKRIDSRLDNFVDRMTLTLVVLFKNMLRPSFDLEESKMEDSKDITDYNVWKADHAHLFKKEEETMEITNEQFSLKILASRKQEETDSGKEFEGYVIETNHNGKAGRVVQRFSHFLILHQKLVKLFPKKKLPVPPRKHRFSKHTPEFVETRRRELENFMKELCSIPEILHSDEIHEFLFFNIEELSDEEKAEIEEKQRNLAYAESNLLELLQCSKDLLSTKEGLERIYNLYPTLKNVNSMVEIPSDFSNIIRLSKTVQAYLLYHHFHIDELCEQHISTTRKMYTLTPFTAVRGILSVTNPVNLLQDLTNIFLAKPLGAKSLAQRMILEGASQNGEFNEPAKNATRAALGMPSVALKIKNVATNRDALQACFDRTECENERMFLRTCLGHVLKYDEIEPILERDDIHTVLTEEIKLSTAAHLLEITMRRDDMHKMVEFCGNDEVIRILKTLISIFFKPLAEVYQSANLGELLVLVKTTISKILEVAENRCLSSSAAFSAYRKIIDEIEEPLFQFLLQMVKNDKGSIEETINWFLKLVDNLRKDREDPYTVDFDTVFDVLSDEDLEKLQKEVHLLDHHMFATKYQREIRLSKFEKDNRTTINETAIENILLPKQGNDDLDIGEHLGIDGFISDEDLEDLSISDSPLTRELFLKYALPNLPFLNSLVPQFKTHIHDTLLKNWEEFL